MTFEGERNCCSGHHARVLGARFNKTGEGARARRTLPLAGTRVGGRVGWVGARPNGLVRQVGCRNTQSVGGAHRHD